LLAAEQPSIYKTSLRQCKRLHLHTDFISQAFLFPESETFNNDSNNNNFFAWIFEFSTSLAFPLGHSEAFRSFWGLHWTYFTNGPVYQKWLELVGEFPDDGTSNREPQGIVGLPKGVTGASLFEPRMVYNSTCAMSKHWVWSVAMAMLFTGLIESLEMGFRRKALSVFRVREVSSWNVVVS
jgi:hypothetical protein